MRNPFLYADYPDPDVIRVGNRYYMITTTMHVFPGGDLLTSTDLVHWELCCHVFDRLDSTPAQRLEQGHIYGKGMWAASLRYHQGIFHIFFVCNDTGRSYHYTAEKPEGPWTHHPVEGFYHDASILFDDDGKVYLAYGNREIRIVEMEPDLSRPKAGGLNRVALQDEGNLILGFEGTHIYKRGDKYYLFMIHWPKDGHARRTQACYVADSLTGEFHGKDILDDDMGFFNQGVAQGAMVDTPDGRWYAILFQDHGACGRMPVLMPMRWEDDFPVIDCAPPVLEGFSAPDVPLRPLISSDDLRGDQLADWWQWNHEPDLRRVECTPDGLLLRPAGAAQSPEFARNTLTQRTSGPRCAFEVTLDASGLLPGCRAGLMALQSQYAACLVERRPEGFHLLLETKTDAPAIMAELPLPSLIVRLRAEFDFTDMRDKVRFFLRQEDGWQPIGPEHQLVYTLEHFMGCRIGLACYAPDEENESRALFSDFLCTLSENE